MKNDRGSKTNGRSNHYVPVGGRWLRKTSDTETINEHEQRQASFAERILQFEPPEEESEPEVDLDEARAVAEAQRKDLLEPGKVVLVPCVIELHRTTGLPVAIPLHTLHREGRNTFFGVHGKDVEIVSGAMNAPVEETVVSEPNPVEPVEVEETAPAVDLSALPPAKYGRDPVTGIALTKDGKPRKRRNDIGKKRGKQNRNSAV